jgi:hypothetical protein
MAAALEVETDRAGSRTLSPDAMADRLLSVVRHQALEFRLRLLVFDVCVPGAGKDAGEFGPSIGGAHVDDADRLDARPWWFNAEQSRGSPLSTQRQNFFSAVSRRCWKSAGGPPQPPFTQ